MTEFDHLSSKTRPVLSMRTDIHLCTMQSAPSSENMETFLNNLVDATNLSLREYFIGDFFDADWKRFHAPCSDCQGLSKDFDCGARRPRDRECEVAYHFGLFTSDGKGKGFVIP